MNSDLNKSGSSPEQPPVDVWDRWLQATGVDDGYGYYVPDEVWNAAWHGNWPDDEETIQWILDEYLDLELAKAAGYLELALPIRQQGQAALNTVRNKAKQQREIKIDADIDEVIKTIRGLGLERDEKASAAEKCGAKPRQKRDRRMRSTTAILMMAAAALCAFVAGYSHPVTQARAVAFPPSPEIRRTIPVEPEIRRAIPVEPEIRKAIPVQTREPKVVRRSRSMQLRLRERQSRATRERESSR
jgi:hypothetical protein